MSVRILSDQYPYDMGSWLEEKSQNVLKALSYMHQAISSCAEGMIAKEIEEDLMQWLYPALYDATKILSFASGGHWTPGDRELMIREGLTGLEKVLKEYGLLAETTAEREKAIEQTRRENACRAFGIISQLLDSSRGEFRSQIHSELRATSVNMEHPALSKLIEETETLMMGDVMWDEYVERARPLVGDLLCGLCMKTEEEGDFA